MLMPTINLTIEQMLQQAVALHQNGQLQDAERIYRDILQLHPNHPEANHNMGVLAVQKMQPAIGLPHFMAALEADPTRGQYWLSYIDALLQAGQTEAAREVFNVTRRSGLQGAEIDAMELRLVSNAPIANQTVSVPQQADPSPQEVSALVTLFNAGRYAEAATLAQEMTVRYPQYAFGWGTLGVVLQQLGRNEEALFPMQKAVALSPEDAQAYSNLGNTLSYLGKHNDAVVSFRRALEIKPDFAEVHANLGATLHDLGRLEEAEACYQRAIQLKPDLAEAHNNRGTNFKKLGRLDEAEACCRQAIFFKPNFAQAYSNLGGILDDLGAWKRPSLASGKRCS